MQIIIMHQQLVRCDIRVVSMSLKVFDAVAAAEYTDALNSKA